MTGTVVGLGGDLRQIFFKGKPFSYLHRKLQECPQLNNSFRTDCRTVLYCGHNTKKYQVYGLSPNEELHEKRLNSWDTVVVLLAPNVPQHRETSRLSASFSLRSAAVHFSSSLPLIAHVLWTCLISCTPEKWTLSPSGCNTRETDPFSASKDYVSLVLACLVPPTQRTTKHNRQQICFARPLLAVIIVRFDGGGEKNPKEEKCCRVRQGALKQSPRSARRHHLNGGN